MSRALPVAKDVRDLFEELLGRGVDVSPADPVRSGELPKTMVSLYVDDSLKLAAVVGMDLPLAVYSGAALGLLPPNGARDAVADGQLSPMLAENVGEVCNVLNGLINHEGLPHVRLYQTFVPGEDPPPDAAGQLLALGRRLDLKVEVAGYGTGKFSLVLVG
jgi:hypothetical protein